MLLIKPSCIKILQLSFNFKTYMVQLVLKVYLYPLLKSNSASHNCCVAWNQDSSTNHGNQHPWYNLLKVRIYLNLLGEAQRIIYFKCVNPRRTVLMLFTVKCKLPIRHFCFKLSGLMVFFRKSLSELFVL